MAEPWTDDLAALGNQTRNGLRSLAITRAVCDHHDDSRPKMRSMRFFKQHPALATLLVLAILGIATPVAYAIVDHVFLSIDTTKSEADIEADVHSQLEAAVLRDRLRRPPSRRCPRSGRSAVRGHRARLDPRRRLDRHHGTRYLGLS